MQACFYSFFEEALDNFRKCGARLPRFRTFALGTFVAAGCSCDSPPHTGGFAEEKMRTDFRVEESGIHS